MKRFGRFFAVNVISVCLVLLSGPLFRDVFLSSGQNTLLSSCAGQDKLPSAPAGSGAKEVTLSKVRAELRRLDSDQLSDRDQAEKNLLDLGPAVLPFLPEINANTSGEMKVRLQRIREQLQKSNIQVFFEASQITLLGKLPIAEVIANIAKQTSNEISLENEDAISTMVELDVTNEPFWKVMSSVMRQGNLRIDGYSSMDGLALAVDPRRASVPGPEPYSTGPFFLQAVSVQTSLPFQASLGGTLDISLQLTWEPRLKPVFLQLPMSKMKVRTDDDQEVLAANPQASPEVPLNVSNSTTQLDLQFARPLRSAKKIKKISGEFVIAVPSEKHKYVFEKFASGGKQSEKFGEVTVTLEGSRRNGSVYEMRVLTEFKDAQGALDSFRGWILSNRAYLVDANDNRIENVGLQTYTVGPEAVGVAFLFQINGNPNDYRLVYESPGMITRQTVPFELENIDLP